MNADFSKPYDPKETESAIYRMWLDSGSFNPDKLPGKRKKNYVVYMPLPNVTGTLHMGHALDNTGSDILVRYYRMKGLRTLWLPGTDHAGIATQYKVEKELQKEGTSRFKLGREEFIKRVWQWKEEYGGIIIDQLKKLGVSADWSRLRFTMDEAYAKDVLSAFIHYHEKGFVYRGKRTVNWCPRCGTSLSELELEHREERGTLWYIRYPLTDGGQVIVATTRPETMLGDTAVAVNPKDGRYTKLVGKTVRLPLTDREIPIVADLKIDPGFGTGAVKVTPAHDILDFEIGQRHKLASIQVIDERGKMNADAGSYAGVKTEEARKAIVERLKAGSLIEKEEPYSHNVTICYRCRHIIEPIPSMQWFLAMDKLAQSALKAVKSGNVDIQPDNFKRIYFEWLENIRDWTVSRQLWWGHQLPVYFCRNKQEVISNDGFRMTNGIKELNRSEIDSKFIVAIEKPKACPFCKHCDMIQSTDVLDTWFSSALWPFAGMTESDRKNYYPGNFVSNARDILNLWDARMIFSGIEFMGKPPFQNVFVHGTILTKDGKRMSKSLGTGIDPLKYIGEFGADATRFAVVWQANGQDIRWDEAAVMAGRKFCNKIWNASRFVIEQSGNSKFEIRNLKLTPETAADRTILTKLSKIKKQTEKSIEQFEFAKALQGLYDFFWHDFCDRYLEESKKQIGDEKTRSSTQAILRNTLVESLKILHPFMPFVTEAVYQNLDGGSDRLLMTTEW